MIMIHHKRPRAEFYTYNDGDIFVTVCTKHMCHHFGSIIDGKMTLSPLGEELNKNILEISAHLSDIQIPLHVIMPNHFHAIVSIDGTKEGGRVNSGKLNYLARIAIACGESPVFATHHNSRLAVAIGSIKSHLTRFANRNRISFSWQERYHDHGIRNRGEGNRIAYYIEHNPELWDADCFNNPPRQYK